MRMVVAGGGTGGHLFPGVAVAETLRRRRGGEVLFIGSDYGIERRVIPPTGFGLHTIPIRGLRGRGLRGVLEFVLEAPRAFAAAWAGLRRFRPDIVLGVGGYASFPVVCAAWVRRIPTVLLEQNARPGLTTRLLARVANAVCTGFPEAAPHLPPGMVVCTGNPVRPQRARDAEKTAAGSFTLLVCGGSQGAHRINVEAVAAARMLKEHIPHLRVIHQTGEADAEIVRAAYRREGIPAVVEVFIDDMDEAYARADLVVCRAGASTLAELTALGKAGVLIPYPFAADDHQRANAEALQRRGAAVMILDRDLTAAALAGAVACLAQDQPRLAAMREAARALGRPDAAERVLDVCERVVVGRRDG